MPSVRDIVEHLALLGDATWPAADTPAAALDAEVTAIAPDQLAAAGGLAWLSPVQHRKAPERVAEFRGALLLCPADAEGAPRAGGVALRCASPKLAFTRAVTEFFPALVETAWPQQRPATVAPDARIGRGVVLSEGVVIGPGVTIGDGSRVGPNSCVAHCTIGANASIGCNCTIGMPGFGFDRDRDGEWRRFPHVGTIVIEDDVEIGNNTCIDRGALGETRILRGAKIDNLVHVAHNVTIGRNALVIANAMIAGSTRIGDGAWVAPSVSVLNQLTVGEGATLGMGAVVLKDVAPGAVIVGNPGKPRERKEPA